jgi:hypothetical protein
MPFPGTESPDGSSAWPRLSLLRLRTNRAVARTSRPSSSRAQRQMAPAACLTQRPPFVHAKVTPVQLGAHLRCARKPRLSLSVQTAASSPRRPPSGSFCFSRLPSRCSSRPQSQSARPAPRVCKPEAAAVQRRAAPDPDLARSRWAALTRVRFELGFRTFGGVSGVLGVAVNCWGSGPGLGL